ncbi:MAG: hypothetical protein EXR69_07385 [Myxococcales bacterium]|nr:hypothetical protein [Myxococcales bacterium]
MTEGFDPVRESELRFDASTAAWAGDMEGTPVDGAEVWTGRGTSTAELYLNRGHTYAAFGSFTADVASNVSVVVTMESGTVVTLASWAVGAGETLVIDEDIGITSSAHAFHVSLEMSAEGNSTLVLQLTGDQWSEVVDARAAAPVQLAFLMHIEDTGALTTEEVNWQRRAAVVAGLSRVLASHGAALTLQPGESFIAGEAIWSPGWFAAREDEGMSWSVHVHNEADGEEALERSVRNGIQNYAAAGIEVKDLNGGWNLAIWRTLAKAGLESLTAFKNPETQLDLARPHVQPWRPAEGTGAADEDAFSTHDPDGPLVYLPGSGVRDTDHARFTEVARRQLSQVRAHAKAGYVNTWYFMEHVDGFGPDATLDEFDAYLADGLESDLAHIDAALSIVIDPLVAAGEVQYSHPDAMRRMWQDWEGSCLLGN